MEKMTVIINGKEEQRKVDKYEMTEWPNLPIRIPVLRNNEEIYHTMDGKTIVETFQRRN